MTDGANKQGTACAAEGHEALDDLTEDESLTEYEPKHATSEIILTYFDMIF